MSGYSTFKKKASLVLWYDPKMFLQGKKYAEDNLEGYILTDYFW